MIDPVPPIVTDILGWTVIVLFLGAWLLEEQYRSVARWMAASSWGLFGLFWLLLIPHFALTIKSPIESLLAALAVPAALYAGYMLIKGRDSLFTLSRAVSFMGLVYLPFETIEPLRRFGIETVASQVHTTIVMLGYEATLTTGPDHGYQSAILFTTGGGQFVTHIVLACTGLGSIAIFAGLIAALDAPLVRKFQAFGLATVVIYILNIIRNVFIAVAFGHQWFQIFVNEVLFLTGYTDPGLVSFFIADRVIAQSLSVVALIGITYLVVRTVPELLTIIEDALYVVTRSEYDLHAVFPMDGVHAGEQ